MIEWNHISDNVCKQISKNLKGLISLDLSKEDDNIENNDINDEGVISICENLKNLSELRVQYNSIGFSGCKSIIDNLLRLKNLNIGI